LNTLAVLIGFVGNNALAVFFYGTVGSPAIGLFFLLLNLVLVSALLGSLEADLGRWKGKDE